MPHKFKNAVILIASIYFYSWGGPKFIFVILGTTFLDYFLVNAMHNQKTKSAKNKFLVISLCLNLGLLFYFKYCNFFIDNINELLGTEISWLKVVLPIGISFYTFESLTYVIDVYRGVHKPLKNFWHYQTYILLFPKLIAGPIVRYNDIADQITDREKNYTPNIKLSGFLIFCLGLAKKTIIANTLGMQADADFKLAPAQLDTAAAWVGALAYTFQIYFDFSGYSDMAIGLGKMMGFRFPENFKNPYTSASINEFWRRWHITLGTWMKNYLYIPLGGNKNSNAKLYRNLIIVFLFSGLWHGASWNFVLWGLFLGVFMVIEKILKKYFDLLPRFALYAYALVVVNYSRSFFYFDDFDKLSVFLGKLFYSPNPIGAGWLSDLASYSFLYVVVILFCIPWDEIFPKTSRTNQVAGKYYRSFSLVFNLIFLFIATALIVDDTYNPFIYFRF